MPWKGPESIVRQLTTWYISALFVLVLGSAGYLYWFLAHSLSRGNRDILHDRFQAIAGLISGDGASLEAARERVEKEWPTRRFEPVYVRISDSANRTIVISPQAPSFLSGPESTWDTDRDQKIDTPDGRLFFILARSMRTPLAEGGEWVLRVALDSTKEEAVLIAYRNRLLLVVAAMLLVSLVVGRNLALRSFRPVERMVMKTREIGSSTLHERFDLQGVPIELRSLGTTINGMLDRLQDSFERLSRFSADIAHELRTPINNLRGQIDVALRKSRTPEEYQDLLHSTLEEAVRVSKTIDSLLFLARAEEGTTQLQREIFGIDQEIANVIGFYEAFAADAEVRLKFTGIEGLKVNLERTLVQRAIGNLLANSIDHTPEGGQVMVSALRESSALKIEVTDNGQGIPPEQLPWVTDRLFRVDASRKTRKLGGSGLGLSIVKGIMKMHGGHLEIESELNQGTRVRLVFPDAISTT